MALVVNWGWGARMFRDVTPAEAEYYAQQYAAELETDHQTLAAETGARKIDANGAWRLLQEEPGLPALLLDGNHPTVFGSLCAGAGDLPRDRAQAAGRRFVAAERGFAWGGAGGGQRGGAGSLAVLENCL